MKRLPILRAPHAILRPVRAMLVLSAAAFAQPQAALAYDYYGGSSGSSSGYGDSSGYGSDSGFGSSFRDKDRMERPYSLSVGNGVAAPSETAFFGENPSGLIYNRRPSVLGFVATGPQRSDLVSNGLSFVAGNGWAAASIGIQSYNNTTDDRGNMLTFNFGMAAYSDTLDTAAGINGMYRFGNASTHGVAPGASPTWTANLGFLYNPFGKFRVGANLYGLSEGLTAVALGIAADVNRFASLTLEASTNQKGQGLTVKPGIGVRAAHVHVAYSYGMQVDKAAPSGITAGNTLGLGYEFNPSFRLDAYYNQVVPYFLGATVSF